MSAGTMRVAIAQTCFAPASIEAAIAEAGKLASQAAAANADLLMLPETFLCGYGSPDQMRDLSLSRDDPAFTALRDLARSHGIAILTGYAERAGPDVFNAAALVAATGDLLLNHRKMHLWGAVERAVFTPGMPSAPVEIVPGIRAGVLICYDLEFAETARDLADRGADIILVVSATGAHYGIVPEHLVPARAYENGVFVAFCNHGARDFVGGSCAAAPDGSLIVAAQGKGSEMIFADIESGSFAAYRDTHAYRRDRRPGLFGSLTGAGEAQ